MPVSCCASHYFTSLSFKCILLDEFANVNDCSFGQPPAEVLYANRLYMPTLKNKSAIIRKSLYERLGVNATVD